MKGGRSSVFRLRGEGTGPSKLEPDAQQSQRSQLVCLGESRVAEEHAATDGTEGVPGSRRWAGGGGGGGGATYVFRVGVCPLRSP